MKTLFLLLFAGSFLTARSTTYYFSSSSGNDARSTNQATNASTPWKTLSKLNSIFNTLRPGDAVLLKRGDTFYGSITVNKSGTPGSPIFIGAYGSGDKPVITSLVRLSNWVSKGHGIWESYNSSLGESVSTVLLNGVEQELGRYPNSDAANKGYLTIKSHDGKTSITDNQLRSSPNWKGAELVLRVRRWILNRNLITRHSGSKIFYATSSSYEPKDRYGYFIQNSIKTLDKFGEWYYDPSTKKLSVYFGSNDPSSYNVQATSINNLIYSFKYSNIVFDNLNIKGANGSGISTRFASNIKITNCNVSFSGRDGLEIKYSPNFTLENSSVSNSNNNGINLGWSGDNAVLRNNNITNSSIFPGMTGSGDGNGNGIFSNGNNNVIEHNQILNTGFIGISFNGNYVTIKNNFINNFCITKDDGAGIYTYTGSGNTDRKGRKIIGNIIMNGKGAWEGTSPPVTYVAEGIYLDIGAAGIEVTDNTVANCSNIGVFIHNGYNITMNRNTIFNSDNRQLNMTELAGNHPKMRNCNLTNNIFFSNLVSQKNLVLLSEGEGTRLFGKFKSNHYARPLNYQTGYYEKKIQAVEAGAKLVSYSNPVRFLYNSSAEEKTVKLDASYVDVRNNKYVNSVTLQPFTSLVLIKSSISFKPKAPIVSIISPLTNATYKLGATINISAKATDPDGTIRKVEFYNGKTLLAADNEKPYAFSWDNVKNGNYTITAKATDNDGVVTVSEAVHVSVAAETNRELAIRIVKPFDKQEFTAPATIRLISDVDYIGGNNDNGKKVRDRISKVEFYNGTQLLRIEYKYPYTYWWRDVKPGTYTITAVVTNDQGVRTTSKSVQVTVRGNQQKREATESNGDSATQEVSVNTDSITAANALQPLDKSTLSLKLSPNPVKNVLNIVTAGLEKNANMQVSVLSVSGVALKTIESNTANQNVQLDVSTLGSGIYIIKVACGNKILSKQFVKL